MLIGRGDTPSTTSAASRRLVGWRCCVVFCLFVARSGDATRLGAEPPEAAPAGPAARRHVVQQIEGWTVHVDQQLLEGAPDAPGPQALRVLANKLHEIALIVPAERVAKLRAIPIWIDLDHPLQSAQYHPDPGWLRAQGHDVAMAKAVHIPDVRHFLDLHRRNLQPSMVLHELAHAYHDQVLGFDDPRIKQVFEKCVEGQRYERVLHIMGHKERHYALTNDREFFAEMTEAYFGTNDFYPFVRAEIADYDPPVRALLDEVWGRQETRRQPADATGSLAAPPP